LFNFRSLDRRWIIDRPEKSRQSAGKQPESVLLNLAASNRQVAECQLAQVFANVLPVLAGDIDAYLVHYRLHERMHSVGAQAGTVHVELARSVFLQQGLGHLAAR
jgi:hypothetical protein